MRTIKFRAWDNEGKEMIRVVGIFFPYENSKSQDIIVNGRGGTANIKPKHLMQFTGLKDKNGKEIYEGDIVRLGSSSVAVYHVEFARGGFRVMFFGDGNIYLGQFADIEVIGNIYENPELIKK